MRKKTKVAKAKPLAFGALTEGFTASKGLKGMDVKTPKSKNPGAPRKPLTKGFK